MGRFGAPRPRWCPGQAGETTRALTSVCRCPSNGVLRVKRGSRPRFPGNVPSGASYAAAVKPLPCPSPLFTVRRFATLALALWLAFAQVYFNVLRAYTDAQAADASAFGLSLLGGAGSIPSTTLEIEGNNPSGGVNVADYLPGADQARIDEAASFYGRPEELPGLVLGAEAHAKAEGCEVTRFTPVRTGQHLMHVFAQRLVAVHERHRETNALLYDLGGEPVIQQVRAETVPLPATPIRFSTFPLGNDAEALVVLQAATFTTDGLAVVINYKRLQAPADGTYVLTHPQWIGAASHQYGDAGDGGYPGYGTVQNDWNVRGTFTPAANEVLFLADLYRAETTHYSPEHPNDPCPPVYQCTMDGVEVCSQEGFYVGSIFEEGHLDYTQAAYDILINGHNNAVDIDDMVEQLAVDMGEIADGSSPVAQEVLGEGCSETKTYGTTYADGVTEYSQSCASDYLGCAGTTCHNPGVEWNGYLDEALGALATLDDMAHDFVCFETGKPPESLSESCDIRIWRGQHLECKVPIGNDIGLTPDCCEEGLKAFGYQDVLAYFKMSYYAYKLATVQVVSAHLSTLTGMVPGWSEFYQTLNSTLDAAIDATLGPLEKAATGFLQELGFATEQGAAVNQGFFTAIEQQLMTVFKDFLTQAFGEDMAAAIIVEGEGGLLEFTAAVQWILAIYYIYQILKIIGHILYACTEDELNLGLRRENQECVFVGKYCADEVLGICVEQRKSFCCYNSMLAALIMASVRGVQNIGGGFFANGTRDAEDPNCEGLTLAELVLVNFSIIDLSPWLNRMREAGIFPSGA